MGDVLALARDPAWARTPKTKALSLPLRRGAGEDPLLPRRAKRAYLLREVFFALFLAVFLAVFLATFLVFLTVFFTATFAPLIL